MKKVGIILAVVIVIGLLCVSFFLYNRDEEPSSEANIETKEHALPNKPVLEINGVELSGKVIDGLTKQPLTAKIKVMNEDQVIATTDCNAAGMFVVSLEDGTYEIAVEHPHYVTKGKYDVNRLIDIDGEPVTVDDTELWPESIVKGRVVSDNQGVEAELQFSYQKDNSGAKYYLFNTIKSDKNGYFMLDNAYGGVQNIRIIADHLVSQKLSDIAINPGETVDLGEIPMEMGLTIFGVVKEDGTDNSIPGASVACVNSNRKIVAKTQTADDGSYTLPVIALNNYRIIILADGFNPSSAFLETQNQNRYEHNVAMTKLAAKKPTPNPVNPPHQVAENNAPMDNQDQNDASNDNMTEEEVAEFKTKFKDVVQANSELFLDCYKELLAIEAAAGRIVFDFKVSPSGDVYDIEINDTEISNVEFLDCMTDAISNFLIPQERDGKLVQVSYPFIFESVASDDDASYD